APARGATFYFLAWKYDELLVSIHAPARGATDGLRAVRAPSVFLSTLPHGERRRAREGRGRTTRFYPRSRTGSDPNQRSDRFQPVVSIHAPARGATLFIGTDAEARSGFYPRSRTGSDDDRRRGGAYHFVSIHA